MDVLALILACSLHSDDALVRVMVDVQSGGNTYFVGDLATLKTNDNLPSAAEAMRVAEEIAKHGGRPAVGLLGVPLDWAAHFGRSPRDLFDGCTNLAIGTAMFAEYHDACSPQRPRTRVSVTSARRRSGASRRRLPIAAVRECVLTRLAGALGLHGTPAEILKRIDVAPTNPTAEAPPETSSIFGDGADDAQLLPTDWSDTRIYVDARVKGSSLLPTPVRPPGRSPDPQGLTAGEARPLHPL